MSIHDQLREEADFADAEYLGWGAGPAINPVMFAKYAQPTNLSDWRQQAAVLLGDLNGKALLDYGCGQGEETSYFAKLGAHVTAIDISEVGIRLTRERAEHNGIADRVDARVADALQTGLPDASFDLAHGMGILHHIDLNRALVEVHRLLKPGGRAVFLEPMGSSRMIEACKRRLQARFGRRFRLRPVTSGEENLKLRELRRACQIFAKAEIIPYHLVYRVRKLLVPRRFHNATLAFDHHALRALPFLSHFAGAAVIHLEKSATRPHDVP